ncbi:hypothetical protein BEWA_032400 [Theileria equi strain WA]|uniref:Uncharacterized protein n=1 Tax=Theileria equi strain WA TaxID=1537102 RepID=L0AXV4_THEEQ|nr:hypothetical protein BEWA_032400 [Theileria equi strain WA]AFZ80387.1 hypothetical protein BEWA_032400 [Theileria equi strain WA]|eukprot:XP_004830053.1 hypothetical protein BEWA_032400 [Theileria equi strain WA]
MSSINIKRKCPNGEKDRSAGAINCPTHNHFKASLSNLDGKNHPHYRVCRHKRREVNILSLKYGSEELKDESGKDLTSTHTEIDEVYTYYSKVYDKKDEWNISRPLLLRILDKGKYYLYENADAKNEKDSEEQDKEHRELKPPTNTKWRGIPDNGFYYVNGNPTQALKEKLNRLTCDLHNLHIVDIHKTVTYKCACDETVVTNEPIIGRYIKYNHSYSSGIRPIRYKNVSLEDDYQLLTLTLDYTLTLTVYYWDEDKEHTRPLMLDVYVEDYNSIVPVSNNGEEDNSKWTIIGELGSASEKQLQEHKCKLFNPVTIDVSAKTEKYDNLYCIKEGCKKESPHKVMVENYGRLALNNYKAKRHTYGGKKFTITGFTGEPKIHGKELPIWNVKEVVIFFLRCPEGPSDPATNTPLLVYVNNNGGSTHKWYKNEGTNAGYKLAEEKGLGTKNLQEVYSNS